MVYENDKITAFSMTESNNASNPGPLTFREGFNQNAGHRGLNPGCPTKSGMSGCWYIIELSITILNKP
jgi:hypothetical protein